MTAKPLFDVELEQTVLGSLLLDPMQLGGCGLKSEDLYLDKHKTILDAMNTIFIADNYVDNISLVSTLKNSGKLADVGGDAYITLLLSVSVTSLGIDAHIKDLQDLARRRSLVAIAEDMAKIAHQETEPEKHVPGLVDRLVSTGTSTIKLTHIKDALGELYTDILERYEQCESRKAAGLPVDDIWGLKTGLLDLDKAMGGISGEDMILVTGESSMGKTKLMMQIAFNLGKQAPGVIFSIEMSQMQILRRQLSAVSKVETKNMKVGNLTPNDMMQMSNAIQQMEKLPIWIADPSDLSTAQVRSVLQQYKSRFGIQWFALDYMYLLSDGAGLDENNKTIVISAALKRTCKACHIPGLIIHSLNKAGDMRGSGQVKYDCDVQLDLTGYKDIPGLPEVYSQDEKNNLATCIFKKGREITGVPAFRLVKDNVFPMFHDYLARA
jgi:replicative DNA helicase